MGLDMYLKAKRYIGATYEHNNIKGKIELTEGKDNKIINIPFNRISEITCSAAYWRKFNALHKWFVNNIQNGSDDCKEYYVDNEKLQEVIDLCKEIKTIFDTLEYELSEEQEDFFTKEKFQYKIFKNTEKIEELLPTSSGFFFGSTSYDEYYLRDIEDTINQLEQCLKEFDNSWNFYYTSSW